MSETPAEYHLTPPVLRPLNAHENTYIDQIGRENKQLSDALTQAKIQLGDRHAEIRMMRVAVDVLTTRALKAEARVKEQTAELADAEREKLVLNEALRKGRNTTTGTGLPGFTIPQAKGVAYWEPAAPEGKEVAK